MDVSSKPHGRVHGVSGNPHPELAAGFEHLTTAVNWPPAQNSNTANREPRTANREE